MINGIEINPFTKGSAYIVGTAYKLGNYKPYIYKTNNYGNTWQLIVNGIDTESFTRALKADPKRKGLLYAGTEKGMYISFNDGKNWQSFQQNLPIVPITDLAIKDDNLIAATQGRSLWLIDDLTPLHQLHTKTTSKMYFIQTKSSLNLSGGSGKTSKTAGTNHPGGVAINYYINKTNAKDTITLSFFDTNNKHIKTFSTAPNKDKKEANLKVKDGTMYFTGI
jgi:hypothetical protein